MFIPPEHASTLGTYAAWMLGVGAGCFIAHDMGSVANYVAGGFFAFGSLIWLAAKVAQRRACKQPESPSVHGA